jgi:hypothetical protein
MTSSPASSIQRESESFSRWRWRIVAVRASRSVGWCVSSRLITPKSDMRHDSAICSRRWRIRIARRLLEQRHHVRGRYPQVRIGQERRVEARARDHLVRIEAHARRHLGVVAERR